MTLNEAIKTRRRYRRQGTTLWIHPDHTQQLIQHMDYAEFCATDWEVENAPVTIGRAEFDAAWFRALGLENDKQLDLRDKVARELGL